VTRQELQNLKRVVADRFYGLDGPSSTMDPHWYSGRLEAWNKLLDELDIDRSGKLTDIIFDIVSEVRVEDPTGAVLRMTRDQAMKILTLGMP
jgi:hypothetical protein